MSRDLTKPIDRTDPDFAQLVPMLKDLQGNILIGHGRNHSLHLFLRFRLAAGALSEAKLWLQKFAEERITSASRHLQERDDYRAFNIPGGLFVNFFLSAAGYRILGATQLPGDAKFAAGMKASQADLADPDPQTWDLEYQQTIHASILLAHGYESELDREALKILQEIREFADVVTAERGQALRNENGEPIEHFGYVDGRSQPLFFADEIAAALANEPGIVHYDPSAGLDLILVHDPHGKKEVSFGSYFVFRKLEQNVRGFKEAEEELASILGLTEADEERAGALAVGRFEDGTPVALHETKASADAAPNNFSYVQDPEGMRCPLHAHIRKMNPRGETVDAKASNTERAVLVAKERSHRIARRGIPYGTRRKDPKDNPKTEELPTKNVGLLFMCFQSDLANQFEFLQKHWANDQDPQRKTGLDPLIGQTATAADPQSWPATWGGKDRKPFAFGAFVTLKGGEYFFAPSISGLVTITSTR